MCVCVCVGEWGVCVCFGEWGVGCVHQHVNIEIDREINRGDKTGEGGETGFRVCSSALVVTLHVHKVGTVYSKLIV